MSQYIGKTISLISNKDNRYVGLLESIDSEQGIVTLRNMRCFGTEGRRNWGADEVYPNPVIYNSVAFNGSDVKDLSILDCPLEQVYPVLPPQMMVPPENFQADKVQGSSTKQMKSVQQTIGAVGVPAAVAEYGVYSPEKKENLEESKTTPAKKIDGNFKVQQNQQQQQKRKSQRQKQDAIKTKNSLPADNFDFESNNARFCKPDQEVADVMATGGSDKVQADETFYNKKSSFFDSISTSTETDTNMRWQEERQLNMDTFGQSSVRHRNNRSWRGRSKGRGGYRGNRGRGGLNTRNTSGMTSERLEF